jgi:hypothetical protein
VAGLNVTRLLRAANAGSKKFPDEKHYSWYPLPTRVSL